MAWQNAGGGPGVGAMGAETSGVQAYTLQGIPTSLAAPRLLMPMQV